MTHLIIRIAVSLPFLYHGSAILFGLFGGPGPTQFALAHGYPIVLGYLVGLAEFGGAILIASGIGVRLGAAGIVGVMLGAIFLVHMKHGYDVTEGGVEYALTHVILCVGLVMCGPGRYSLASLLPGAIRRPAENF